ncbi:MAG: hypothetical protein P8181_14855, partial [bacterium]
MRILPFFLVILCLSFPTLAQTGDWAGEIVDVDGIPHVRNPAEPMSSDLDVGARLLWRAGGDEASDVLFGTVVEILLDDDGNTYMLDQQLSEIKLYDAEGRFLRTLGRSGEGPGEFNRPGGMFLIPNDGVGVFQMMPSRVVALNREGEPQPPPSIPGDSGMRFFEGIEPAGNAFIVAQSTAGFDGTKATVHKELISVSLEGEKLATMWTQDQEQDLANLTVGDDPDNPTDIWEARWGGGVYLNTTYDEFVIEVMAVDGTVTRVIERVYETVERTKEDIEKIKEAYDRLPAGMPNMNFKIAPMERDIQQMSVRPRGELWVVSSQSARSAEEGAIGSFEVFD